MTIGTRSVLYGAHCFFLHPWFVAWGWAKLYGFPWDPRLWVAFFVHDLGYIGKPNMDGAEGSAHPVEGAAIMRFLFGPEWGSFCARHSRFFARLGGKEPSRLCFADKLAIVLTPRWLYLPMVKATGEIDEYMDHAIAAQRNAGKYAGEWDVAGGAAGGQISGSGLTPEDWHRAMTDYMEAWVAEHG